MLAVADDVVPSPTDHAEVVDAAVLKKTAVFNCQNALNEIVGKLVVGDKAPLGAVGVVAQAGDEQRLKFVAGKGLAMVVGNRSDNTRADMDGGAVLRVIGLRAGVNGDRAP